MVNKLRVYQLADDRQVCVASERLMHCQGITGHHSLFSYMEGAMFPTPFARSPASTSLTSSR
jgi:hypothetical protein